MFRLLTATIILSLCTGISTADIINIPDDQETIQAGIDASEDGDTVRVAPGEYVENINFEGKSISVIGNPEGPGEVIIDGGENGQSVVVFRNEEDSNSILSGVTLQNGNTDYGGAIYINGASPTLTYLHIRDNRADRSGGGIYATEESQAQILFCHLFNNYSYITGGGITSFGDSDLNIQHCSISENTARMRGGGVSIGETGNATIERCLITHNTSAYGSGVLSVGEVSLINCTIADNIRPRFDISNGLYVQDGHMSLHSCIVWSDRIAVVHGDLALEYTNLENGQEGIISNEGEYYAGEGNIADDPLFLNPENNYYSFIIESPCIDAGDPDEEADPDGTRADMGAFPFLGTLILEGYVLENMSGNPIDSVEISTSYGAVTYTDETGFYRFTQAFENLFDLSASLFGYTDSTLMDVELEFDDTLEVVFRLLHPKLFSSEQAFETELLEGETIEYDFTIENHGDANLEWSARTKLRGEIGIDPWALRRSYPIEQILDAPTASAVIFMDDRFYISIRSLNDDPAEVQIMNLDGRIIGSFEQPFPGRLRFRDMAWDGELIWGCIEDTVFGIDLTGEVRYRFPVPNEEQNMRNITFDYENEWLWLAGYTTNLYGCNRAGEVQMEIDIQDIRIFGLAYYAEDPDDASLYIASQNRDIRRQTIHKVNIETGEILFVATLDHGFDASPHGAFITESFDDYSTVFMNLANLSRDDGGSSLDVWQIDSDSDWMTIVPEGSVIDPAGETDVTLTLDATDLLPIHYPAEIVFTLNAVGGETLIPIDLTVTPLAVDYHNKNPLPMEFAITAVYPNPFNSTVRLSYAVPRISSISINVYDITGSLIEEVVGGIHQSGQHTTTWDASNLPSGIYLARMTARDFSQTIKLTLLK